MVEHLYPETNINYSLSMYQISGSQHFSDICKYTGLHEHYICFPIILTIRKANDNETITLQTNHVTGSYSYVRL